MHSLVQDVRYALRQLVKSPGFALTAVISLAMGIGATTAVFSVIYGALMSPFPFRAANRIVRLTLRQQDGGIADPDFTGEEIRELRQLDAVESLLVMDYHPMTITGRELPDNVAAVGLISTGFADLGVPPLLGRGIGPADAVGGQEPQPVVVLSYEFWRKQFLSDPEVLGKTLQLDHTNYTIIGVAAPRFKWYNADVYLPLKVTRDPGTVYMLDLRLKPGVTLAAANSQLQPLVEEFARQSPKRFRQHFRVQVEGLNAWVIRKVGGTLYLLFAGVGLLLAVGCGNVSILLLARGAAREHELAVRAAVGAGRWRVVRQLLTESMLLAALGVVLGGWLSYAMLAGIRLLLPKYSFAPEAAIRINFPVLLFSATVALATGILFGLWPALRLSRGDVGMIMQSGARRVAGTVHGRRSHDTLVAAQIALTLLLLAGAGSAMESFLRLMHTPLGYDPHNVVSLWTPLRENSYTTWEGRAAYFERMRAKVADTPGVTMTAISTNATPPQNGWGYRFEIQGGNAAEEQRARFNMVGSGYFRLLRIPLLEGRIWTAAENAAGARLAVINRTMAQRYFREGHAIGRSIKLPAIDDGTKGWASEPNAAGAWIEIIGIVQDARNDGLDKPVQPAVFVPYSLSMPPAGTQILVRGAVPPLTLMRAMREQLSAVNPEQQIYGDAEGLETWIADEPAWQQAHLTTWVFGIFSGLALVLAAVGLFSVVSYTVAQRANEFGIRVALGARPGDVLRMVFGSTAVSVGGGMAVGLALTMALNRILAQWIRGSARDPWILVAGTLLLALVAGIACALPAWRAARADPMAALRCP